MEALAPTAEISDLIAREAANARAGRPARIRPGRHPTCRARRQHPLDDPLGKVGVVRILLVSALVAVLTVRYFVQQVDQVTPWDGVMPGSCTTAPEEIPEKMPSLEVSSRFVRSDALESTRNFRFTSLGSKIGGTNPSSRDRRP